MALLKSLVFAVLVVTILASEVSYEGYEVIRATPGNDRDVNFLRQLREKFSNKIDFWLEPRGIGIPVDMMVAPKYQEEIHNRLSQNSVDFRQMIADVQRIINDERKTSVQSSFGVNTTFNYTLYNDYNSIQAWINLMVSEHPDIASKVLLGKSFEGREIYTLKLGKPGQHKPIIFYNGGTHAREWIGPATVIYMTKMMIERYGKYAEMTNLLDNIDWYITPVLNADGYVYSFTKDRNWRKTRSPNNGSDCIGTDPNRNWDIHWNETGASSDPCSDQYAGSKPFSEVEIKSISNMVNDLRDRVMVYIDFHSYSQLWMTPYGWTPKLPPDYDALKSLGDKAVKALKGVHGTVFKVGSISNIIYPASGSSADWAYGVAKIKYSFGVELRDTGDYGFLLPATQIQPSGEETFEAMKVLGHHILNDV